MTISRKLSDMRLPLQANFGGVQPDMMAGLDWSCSVDNWLHFDSGACVCPYPDGNRIVTLPAGFDLNIPTQPAGTTRVHLWLHDDDNDGIGTVVFDNPPSFTNYFGSAITNPNHVGWRYLGTCLLGTGLNPIRQQCIGNRILFTSNMAQAPFELFSGVSTTSARTFAVNGVAPPSAITSLIIGFAQAAGNVTRIAASAATCGFTVNSGIYTQVVTAGTAELTVAVGADGLIQFISDAAGNSIVFRGIGYNFKR